MCNTCSSRYHHCHHHHIIIIVIIIIPYSLSAAYQEGLNSSQPLYCIHTDHVAPSENGAFTFLLGQGLSHLWPLSQPHSQLTPSCPALGARQSVPVFSHVLLMGPALGKTSRIKANFTSIERPACPYPHPVTVSLSALFFFVTLSSYH